MGPFRRIIQRRQVVVNMLDGSAFTGVFFRQDGPLLVLKNAQFVQGGSEPAPLDGDVVIERSKVLFIQVP